jgi:hypothetical protein
MGAVVWPAVGGDDDAALALDELRVPRHCGDSADESLRVARGGSGPRNGACSVPGRDRRSDRQRIGARIGGTNGAGRPRRSASGPGESHTSEDSPSVSPSGSDRFPTGCATLVTMLTIISKSTLTSRETSDLLGVLPRCSRSERQDVRGRDHPADTVVAVADRRRRRRGQLQPSRSATAKVRLSGS